MIFGPMDCVICKALFKHSHNSNHKNKIMAVSLSSEIVCLLSLFVGPAVNSGPEVLVCQKVTNFKAETNVSETGQKLIALFNCYTSTKKAQK